MSAADDSSIRQDLDDYDTLRELLARPLCDTIARMDPGNAEELFNACARLRAIVANAPDHALARIAMQGAVARLVRAEAVGELRSELRALGARVAELEARTGPAARYEDQPEVCD